MLDGMDDHWPRRIVGKPEQALQAQQSGLCLSCENCQERLDGLWIEWLVRRRSPHRRRRRPVSMLQCADRARPRQPE
ncbi:hypothetical protein C7374_11718 [Falsochrobactrum ovis]|uniref:Uncharacterized protein n=1 Tax=Falsochrobactrum ovis TaxID=1293442 RepID=A0A364JSC6_9HYPH|nr:hypothetical protein C7374_11718 [Falsochrobactrum ovis]